MRNGLTPGAHDRIKALERENQELRQVPIQPSPRLRFIFCP